jgi:hypothetical protein
MDALALEYSRFCSSRPQHRCTILRDDIYVYCRRHSSELQWVLPGVETSIRLTDVCSSDSASDRRFGQRVGTEHCLSSPLLWSGMCLLNVGAIYCPDIVSHRSSADMYVIAKECASPKKRLTLLCSCGQQVYKTMPRDTDLGFISALAYVRLRWCNRL